ncbi:hypothetical protein KDA23_01020 [Candidatus Saccharibacteria bacterium]|nr:hypothetical protein [Candidatus Saccharibacteria bacterium]
MKAVPCRTRLLSIGKNGLPLAIPEGQEPKGQPDLTTEGQQTWIENMVWLYGGVGFCGKNSGYGCACHNTRFFLDYFNRSFVPELERYRIAVLDSCGNLILRIGRYGNEDSSGPGSKVPLGGDEVGLFHSAYVASHTDKRLFIADEGNARILSVKLGYHVNKACPVPADVPKKE